jgi:hypothetical protein
MALDPQIKFLMALASANQTVAQEKRQADTVSMADFQGVAQGTWVKRDEDGTGVVEFKGKEYKTFPQGTKSIAAGTKVNLEYRKGIYISDW